MNMRHCFLPFAGALFGALLVTADPALSAELTIENADCLAGTWSAKTRDTKASSLGIQFDGRGSVWVTLAPDATYIPSDFKLPIVRDLEADTASGKLFFSLPNVGRFYLQEIVTDDILVVRADNTAFAGGARVQVNDTTFERTSATMKCIRSAAAPASSASGDYSPVQALDGFGAIFIALGEPVLFPIDRAQTCKAESGSDLKASGCAVVGFVVSPFLVLRDALVGLGDVVTGGYFRLSRKSGVFRYFEDK